MGLYRVYKFGSFFWLEVFRAFGCRGGASLGSCRKASKHRQSPSRLSAPSRQSAQLLFRSLGCFSRHNNIRKA